MKFSTKAETVSHDMNGGTVSVNMDIELGFPLLGFNTVTLFVRKKLIWTFISCCVLRQGVSNIRKMQLERKCSPYSFGH